MSEEITIDLSDDGRKFSLELSDEQRSELKDACRRHDKAHIQTKAGAILKVARGWSASDVAKFGLARRWAPKTIRQWCKRYLDDGMEGLEIDEGRGRKPAFSP